MGFVPANEFPDVQYKAPYAYVDYQKDGKTKRKRTTIEKGTPEEMQATFAKKGAVLQTFHEQHNECQPESDEES